jgi:hypothetical protein
MFAYSGSWPWPCGATVGITRGLSPFRMRSDATAPDRMVKVCGGGWEARHSTRSGCRPWPIRLTPGPHVVTVVHTLHGAQGGEMFGQAIRRRSRHVRSVIDCFRNRGGPQAAPQPIGGLRHKIR